MKNFLETNSYRLLKEHYNRIKGVQLRDLFASSPRRFDEFSIKFEDLLFDYSKNIITSETIELLIGLAEEQKLSEMIEKMFSGEKINNTENRAVMHFALRQREKDASVDDVFQVRNQMRNFVNLIHSGDWKGCTGETITDIVNIGIGGSDLGPKMVCKALEAYSVGNIKTHFVSNVDGTNIVETLKNLNLERTLFLISSKSFTTQETLTNAVTAKAIFLEKLAKEEKDIAKHFVAVSTNEKDVKEFGIDPKNMFVFWDWVGGRFSLWSSIGLPIALQIGMDNFEKLLDGANAMDLHFKNTDFRENIPVLAALLSLWYTNFFNAKSHCVIAYDQYLEKLPDYLQQLEMESNGKSVSRDGEALSYSTSPIIFGGVGTDSQHSFFQLLHQGTQLIPVDFFAPVNSLNPVGNHHNILLSNFFAQTEALMNGKSREEAKLDLEQSGLGAEEIQKLLPHKIFKGNRPSNSFLYKKMTPAVLGSILSMCEHITFVKGIMWNINSFDQWGVELGKQLAKKILPELSGKEKILSHDSSTNGLINFFKENKE